VPAAIEAQQPAAGDVLQGSVPADIVSVAFRVPGGFFWRCFSWVRGSDQFQHRLSLPASLLCLSQHPASSEVQTFNSPPCFCWVRGQTIVSTPLSASLLYLSHHPAPFC
jgi:hypothetical protein